MLESILAHSPESSANGSVREAARREDVNQGVAFQTVAALCLRLDRNFYMVYAGDNANR